MHRHRTTLINGSQIMESAPILWQLQRPRHMGLIATNGEPHST
jgi:hypothetical protein